MADEEDSKKAKEADVETFCRERIRWKLIYFSMPEVSVNVTDDEAETTISATRGNDDKHILLYNQ